jgi:hypothetical protein
MTAFTATLDRAVTSARVEVAKVDKVKVLLMLAIVVPFLVGWLAHKAWVGGWALGSWLYAAVLVGWRAAAPKADGGG